MATILTEPVATYITAVSANDVGSAVGCFDEDARVRDEGRTIHGRVAIQQWIEETKRKYRHTIEPLQSAAKGDETTVTCRLSGSFPGSPIEARFAFVVQGGKISSLEIR